MVEKTNYCKKCDKVKNIKCFYKNNMSQCKLCKDEINRKNRYGKNDVTYVLEGLYNKINNIEIIYEELNKKIIEKDKNRYNDDINIFLNFIIEMIILQENTYNNKNELIDAIIDFMKHNNIKINKRLNYIYSNFKNNQNDDEIFETIDKIGSINKNIDTIINNKFVNNDYELKLKNILNDID